MKPVYIIHAVNKGVVDIIKSLYNIEELKERYPLEYLDCFEHPTAINYNWLNPDILDLYYAYSKLYSSFYIKNGFDDYDLMDLEEELGIRYFKIHSKDRLLEDIKQLINEGHMVLVPGNLKYLFYSGYYVKENHAHLFIVKGYDEEKELCYIIDSIQEKGEEGIPFYTDFVMRFSDLYDLYEGYREISEPYIYYLEDINSEQMQQERLKSFFEKLYRAIENQQYMEYKILKKGRQADDKGNNNEYLNNIPKYKDMMLLHATKIMEQYSYDVSGLKTITQQLKAVWTQNSRLLVRKLLKSPSGQIEYTFSEETRRAEKSLLSEIENCIQYLSTKKRYNGIKKQELHYEILGGLDVYLENNQDNIIKYNDKERMFIFNFSNGLTYNTWINDQCPKVVLHKGKKPLEKFYLQVKCSIEIDFDKEGHQEGIYVKTDNGNMYAFAIDYIKELIFDNVGINTIKTYDYGGNEQEVTLYYHLEQNKFSYGIILADSTKQEIGTYEFTEKVINAGFFCKTWEECKRLKVFFYMYSQVQRIKKFRLKK